MTRLTDAELAAMEARANAGMPTQAWWVEECALNLRLLAELKAERERCAEFIQALDAASDESDYCFVCKHHPSSGHAPSCAVAKALKETE